MNYPEEYDEYGRKLTNAKEELEYHLDVKDILYANIRVRKDGGSPFKQVILHSNHKPVDLDTFLEEMNTYYHGGYGTQNLEGIIILRDGAILIREEYDGSEWWEWQNYSIIDYDLKEDE